MIGDLSSSQVEQGGRIDDASMELRKPHLVGEGIIQFIVEWCSVRGLKRARFMPGIRDITIMKEHYSSFALWIRSL
jgi:hypothetical protein